MYGIKNKKIDSPSLQENSNSLIQQNWIQSNYQNPLTRLQSSIGHAWIQERIQQDELCYSETGKPYLKNHSFFFNLTHKEHLLAVAFSDVPIGIDVEKIRPVNLAIAKQFATIKEQQWIGTSEKRFFTLFTLKEAYLKMIGSMVFHAKEIEFFFEGNEIYSTSLTFSLFMVEDYILAVCENRPTSGSIQKTNLKKGSFEGQIDHF